MENKMMMPACYSVMTEDEMTYTSGGDAGTAYAVGWVIGTTISIANMVWGIGKRRASPLPSWQPAVLMLSQIT